MFNIIMVFFHTAYYMVCSMALTAMSLVATVTILNIFYHNPNQRVPNWLRKCVLDIFAKVTCFTPHASSQTSTIQEKKDKSDNVSVVSMEEESKEKYKKEIGNNQECSAVAEITNNREDWQRVSKIIDRLCLFLNCFAAVVLFMVLIIGINV